MNLSISNNTDLDHVQDFRDIPTLMIVLFLVLLPLGIIMQLMIIMYERFEMDPMKRNLNNQLVTSAMLWTICLSLVSIIRLILTLMEAYEPSWLIISVDSLSRACMIAILLIFTEGFLFRYYSDLLLQRVPNYNYDFLATWLHSCNIIVPMFLSCIQTILRQEGIQLRYVTF